MRLECWCNRDLPEHPDAIARLLGFDRAEIESSLPGIMPFFAIHGGLIVCPELDDLRATYAERRERMAEGGKRSAEKRKGSKPENGDDDC